jgi:benzylsuccinate CoA-transferase BbsF subunit
MEYTMNGRVMGTQGNRDPVMAPHGNYPCRGEDKWVSIAVKTEEEWLNLCQAMGNPEWTRDGKFADRSSRLRNRDELDKRIADWTSTFTHYEVTEQLQQVGVAAAPCLDVEERYFDPHFQERQTSVDFQHPASGADVIPGVPFKMSQTPCEVRLPAPMMGQHNDYVFRELLSIPPAEIDQLIEDKVIH